MQHESRKSICGEKRTSEKGNREKGEGPEVDMNTVN